MSQLDYAEGDPLLASLNYSSPVVYFQMLASLNTATCFIHIKMVMTLSSEQVLATFLRGDLVSL